MDMLMFQLQKQSSVPLYKQLYREIRTAITAGKIAVGTKLPSKRKLADYLQISQTTVELAYSQLVAEGFIEPRPRKGFFTMPVEELAYLDLPQEEPAIRDVPKPSYAYDFNPARIDTRSFPFPTWRKTAREVIDEENHELLLAGHPQGDESLRVEIARYLYQSRGVVCEPEQIIVGSGTEQLMPLLIRLFDKNLNFGFENPGYALTHSIFEHDDRQAFPIAVDEDGIDVQELDKTGVDIAYVTPSHQFPTGSILSATRRAQLLNWAAAKPERFIIEDDYDSEFRYTSQPIPALQSMDVGGRVIYISTFSKSIMPSLRIAYLVLPPRLLNAYRNTFLHYTSTVPRIDQQIVATFMQKGHFSRHLNRMRKLYRKKLECLMQALSPYQPIVTVSGEQAGMHVVLTIDTERTEQNLVSLASDAGIRVFAMQNYDLLKQRSTLPKIVLGFGGLNEVEIQQGVEQLMHSWNIQKNQLTPKG
ncbi:GntR family transcriptional regulator [Planococcus plakortidis]|uniref:GntR family transcriptional regulator n=1 Tax=Planococcus plakortidis TaxID=1038856 RepID=A0A1C7EAS2_9BACL|nr:PLP-dependent aminotransferase family protein [Planococcus plakortidis]ANU20828.1 GntR family transcriptional regulator [Planococcus plakortidis]